MRGLACRRASQVRSLASRSRTPSAWTTLVPVERSEIVAALASTELLKGVDLAALEQVAAICEVRVTPPGQHVFFQGDLATEFFVVVTGAVRVYIQAPGGELDAALVRAGSMFGEIAMLDGGPRLASALADRAHHRPGHPPRAVARADPARGRALPPRARGPRRVVAPLRRPHGRIPLPGRDGPRHTLVGGPRGPGHPSSSSDKRCAIEERRTADSRTATVRVG